MRTYITNNKQTGDGGITLPLPLTDTSFDNTACDLDGDPATGQAAIEALCNRLSVSASPGFTYGFSGPFSDGFYAIADSVPSNRAGRLVSFTGPILRKVEIAGPSVESYTLEVFEHDGNLTNISILATVVVTLSSSGSADLNVSITQGKRLGVRCSAGTGADVNIGLFLAGGF